ASGRCDHRHLPPNQVGHQRLQLIILALRPTVLDGDVLALDIVCFLQALTKRRQEKGGWLRESGVEEPDHRHPLLLRARGERPRSRHAAEQRDELAALHSITSSARASRLSGTVSPSAFAVFRLITSSNFVGCSTGKSAGLAPLRILST